MATFRAGVLFKERSMSLKKYLKERDAAFEATDIAWARKQMPLSSLHVAEAAFHKARAATSSVSAERRSESLQWLKDNKFAELGRFWQGEQQ
jgi:hypothetical protein